MRKALTNVFIAELIIFPILLIGIRCISSHAVKLPITIITSCFLLVILYLTVEPMIREHRKEHKYKSRKC